MTKLISTGGEVVDFDNLMFGDIFKTIEGELVYIKIPPMGERDTIVNAIRLSDGNATRLGRDTKCVESHEVEVKF